MVWTGCYISCNSWFYVGKETKFPRGEFFFLVNPPNIISRNIDARFKTKVRSITVIQLVAPIDQVSLDDRATLYIKNSLTYSNKLGVSDGKRLY